MSNRAKLILTRDINGNVAYGIDSPRTTDQNFNTILASGVAQSITVPLWCKTVLFAYNPGATVFVNQLSSATLPGAAFAGDTNEMNPILRTAKPGATISLITADTNAYVNIMFFDDSPR